jgi:hypothetical protein
VAQDSQNTEFLFDFIYLDRGRISSYFAQLFTEGALTGTKRVSVSGETRSQKYQAKAVVVGGEMAGNETVTESLEKQFDATWTLPVNVIHRLDELGYIHRSLASAPLAQLVLVQGTLRLLDIRMLRGLWKPIMALVAAAQKKGRGPTTIDRRTFDQLADMIAGLPHALQMTFSSEEGEAWSTLDPAHMTINPDDLALKHGADVSGRWHMIAIVDAKPEESQYDLTNVPPSTAPRELEQAMGHLLNLLRAQFGRAPNAFGVTPVAIFRALEKKTL